MPKSLKKILSIIVASLLLASTAAGCNATASQKTVEQEETSQGTSTPKTSDTEQTSDSKLSEDITLTFWYTYGDAEEKALLDIVLPLWSEKYPNIAIDTVRQDGSQYNQMLITAFGTGQAPDIARIDIVDTASYASIGGIAALDGMEGFSELKASCLAAPMSTNLYKESYYGLPLDTNCKAAVINLKTLASIGLDKAPATLEEFITAAEAGNTKNLLSVSGVGDWDLLPYFWLFGGKVTDDSFKTATGYLDSETSINAVQTMLDLHEKGVFTIRDIDGTVDAWDGIKTGEVAMFFEGPWYFGSYDDSVAAGIEPALIPSYNGVSCSVVGGENIVISETSKHKDAAYEFLKFMLSEEVQLAMLQTGQIPVLQSLVNNAAVTQNPVWGIYMEQLESAKARIPSPNHEAIGQIWSDAMTNIFMNHADVAAELKNASGLIDDQLAV